MFTSSLVSVEEAVDLMCMSLIRVSMEKMTVSENGMRQLKNESIRASMKSCCIWHSFNVLKPIAVDSSTIAIGFTDGNQSKGKLMIIQSKNKAPRISLFVLKVNRVRDESGREMAFHRSTAMNA